MPRPFSFVLFFISIQGFTQTITSGQQKAINDYIEYANRSALEATAVFNKITSYYPNIKYYRTQKRAAGFSCSEQLEDYYFTKAIGESSAFPGAVMLITKLKELRSSAEKLDKQCKARAI